MEGDCCAPPHGDGPAGREQRGHAGGPAWQWLAPVVCYCGASAVMWGLAHRQYTGWSRLQSAACVPLLFTPCRAAAAELIWLNSFGCAISIHLFYGLTGYGVLNLLAARSLRRFPCYAGARNKFALHLGADALLHLSPCLLCWLFVAREPQRVAPARLWLLPAVTHVAYPYLLIGTCNPCALYDLDDIYPAWKYRAAWVLTFVAYSLI